MIQFDYVIYARTKSCTGKMLNPNTTQCKPKTQGYKVLIFFNCSVLEQKHCFLPLTFMLIVQNCERNQQRLKVKYCFTPQWSNHVKGYSSIARSKVLRNHTVPSCTPLWSASIIGVPPRMKQVYTNTRVPLTLSGCCCKM